LPENYLDCLNVDGIMGTLVIDKIKINLPIYHGTRDEVLRKGVGHIKETALPIGGEGSHAVLTSHSGLN
ncbi:sortase, partial [[Clostridium] scindens]